MPYLFVANWKMYLSLNDAINYCIVNKNELKRLSSEHTLVLCPSFITLPKITNLLNNTDTQFGAQDCSQFTSGAYTGQVSAQDVAQAGCAYCIIGHNERRTLCNETNETIAQKTKRLIENNIVPIVCIGETSADCISTTIYATLENQLNPIFTTLQNYTHTHMSLIIAYEPAWTIGAGIIPNHTYLENVFGWLKKITTQKLPHANTFLLYGGSVAPHTIAQLKKITNINGFLIGKLSTDFEQFKSIIQS